MIYEVTTKLKQTQITARDWIREREKIPYRNLRGGLFCDPPGMGKTLSMISAMQIDPGLPWSPTLIIVPPQVIEVWLTEFLNRTTIARDRISIYYGPNRHKVDFDAKILFVISTYAILRNECLFDMSKEAFIHLDPYDEPAFIDGSIFNLNFHRIILDEAHIAKNHKTKVSCALTWLEASIKWIVTATSKINSLDDEYGSFRFLGIFESWEDWRSVVPSTARGVTEAKIPRLRAMQEIIENIKTHILLCRSKALLALPPKTDIYLSLQFSEAERSFYDSLQIYALVRIDALEQTAQLEQFRIYAKDLGSNVLKMIARLKMATNNCHFVLERMERLKGVRNLSDAARILNYYNKSSNRKEECLMCQDCSGDREAPCGHRFCSKCWLTILDRQGRQKAKKEQKLIDALELDIYDGEIEDLDCKSEQTDDQELVGQCPCCNSLVSACSLNEIDTPVHRQLLRSLKGAMTPKLESTKLRKLKEILDQNLNHTKIIVVSQSIPMLDYVQTALSTLYPDQILRIDGSRKVEQRTEDIRLFQDASSKKRILLFSLTCNPEGITLTRATILIHLDHWWNKNGKVEQINNRIHRISQELPTTIYYLYAEGTIENKIFKLQDHKEQLINYDFDKLIEKPRLIAS